jgi:hypothetical protein
MELKPFSFNVIIELEFSEEEADFLFSACELHYDHACRVLADRGPVRGLVNEFLPIEGKKASVGVCRLTQRQLDTLIKALELPAASSREERNLQDRLDAFLRQAMKQAHEALTIANGVDA